MDIFAVAFRAYFNGRNDADTSSKLMTSVIGSYRIVVRNSDDVESGIDGHLG